jgi:peptidoglycan/xylan/chitin deacetylase (PgdA/CDA1 family)
LESILHNTTSNILGFRQQKRRINMRVKYMLYLCGLLIFGALVWGVGIKDTNRAITAVYLNVTSEIEFLRSPPVAHVQQGGNPQVFFAFTFDDGHDSVARLATPYLEKNGMRSTQFIISHTLEDDPWFYISGTNFHMPRSVVWSKLVMRGHEIGSHTRTHPELMKVADPEKVVTEIRDSRTDIAQTLGIPITMIPTFAAPLGSYGPREVEVITKSGYTYAVNAWGLTPNSGQLNDYAIDRFNVGSEEKTEDVCEFIETSIQSQKEAHEPLLIALALHYIEEGDEEPKKEHGENEEEEATYSIRFGTFKGIVDCVARHRDAGDLYVGTFTEAVTAYKESRNRASQVSERKE